MFKYLNKIQVPSPKSQDSYGFTLVELLVAISVFSVAIAIVGAIFVSAVSSQRKNINSQEVLDNARFVLESMGRAVRQSDVVSPDGTSSSLIISHPIKGPISYTLDGNQILENGVPLTSSSIIVDRLKFIVRGNSISDKTQPRVAISFSLKNNVQGSTNNSINIQTTITPRNLQIQ